MSLLLDALKRAEQEKLARRGGESPFEASAHAGQSPSAHRALELETPMQPKSAAAAAATSAAQAATNRESAKTVFAAKQPLEPPTRGRISGGNKAIIAAGIGAVVLIAAGGTYVWYEINSSPSLLARAPAAMPAPRPVAPSARASLAPGAAVTGESATPGTSALPTGKEEAIGPLASAKPELPAPGKARSKPRAVEKLAMSLLKSAAGAKEPPLKLARTIVAPQISPDVSQGYEALRRGDDAAARKFYEAAVAADGTSLDAHLGLATAAARSGDRKVAEQHYRRALELDPKNPSSLAGLASLADFSRPDGLEAQLRADITRHPQSPALHYTLGNLYASQSRWTEAQAAYFEAYQRDPDSADLAYNLAVSLDHLGQAKLATDFYRRALAAARQQSAQFDVAHVTRRVAELKR